MPVADPPLTLATCLLRERLTGNFGCDSDDKKVICDEEPMLLGLDDECASLMKVRLTIEEICMKCITIDMITDRPVD